MPTAIITGAEQGLGAAILCVLKDHDCLVRNISGEIIRQCNKGALENAIDRILAVGSVDILINNFGINHLSWIGETPVEDVEIMHANIMAPYWIVNHLVHKQQSCRCINVSSQTYRVSQRCTTLYAASKAALVSMTRSMARELAFDGWQVNCICPGKIENTRMSELTDQQVVQLRNWTPKQAEQYALQMIPLRRFTSTTEVASAVYQMLQMPHYITGAVIDMMGGV